MLKKTIATVIAASVIFSGVMMQEVSAAPGKDLRIIPIIVNGKKVRFPDTEPYINTDGRTMVPVRFVSEKLGAEVKWEANTQTAIVEFEGKTIRLPIGSKTVTVDGEAQELDTAAEFEEGRTMVPLRFVSEVLGSKVEWDQGAHAVKVTDAAYQAKVDSGEVELDFWGREYSKTYDPYWMRLTDLEETGFYDVDYKSPNREYFETVLSRTELAKYYIDQRGDNIRNYYEAQLNVDYRTIDKEKFTNTLLSNMGGMTRMEKAEQEDRIDAYVDWVKKNKVIAKGYADPENSQIEGNKHGVSMRVYFKFKIISAIDTSQTFMDNWNVSNLSNSYALKKGVWYGGYASVGFDTNVVNGMLAHSAIGSSENMFVKLTYKYEELK